MKYCLRSDYKKYDLQDFHFDFDVAFADAAELLLLVLLMLFPAVDEVADPTAPPPPLYVCQIFLTAARP